MKAPFFGMVVSIILTASLNVFAAPNDKNSTLTVCTEASPDGFDIVRYNSLVATNASADVIFDGLVRLNEKTGEVEPALAKSWEISDDGKSYTFHLRPHVLFHSTAYFKPSRTLNADDVISTFKRMMDKDNAWHSLAGVSNYPHAQSMNLNGLIQSIDRLDDLTVRFSLSQADATFLPILTMGFASIYSNEYLSQLLANNKKELINTQPIGTGPFVLRKFNNSNEIRYARNDMYWDKKPNFSQLIYTITPDAGTRTQKIKRNECQIAIAPRLQDLANVKQDQSLQVIEKPAFMTAFVAINTQHGPLAEKKVRQAINLAFEKKEFVKTIFENLAMPAITPFPTYDWQGIEKIAGYPTNLAQAKNLLKEAGYKDGFKTTIWTRSGGSILNPNPRASAEFLQADLKKIGIQSEIKFLEWGQLIKAGKEGQHDLLFMGWAGDNGSPDNFFTPQFSCAAVESGTNFARYCNSELDNKITQAKHAKTLAERRHIYSDALKIVNDEAIWIPLAYPTVYALTRKNVSGYEASAYGRQSFNHVSLK